MRLRATVTPRLLDGALAPLLDAVQIDTPVDGTWQSQTLNAPAQTEFADPARVTLSFPLRGGAADAVLTLAPYVTEVTADQAPFIQLESFAPEVLATWGAPVDGLDLFSGPSPTIVKRTEDWVRLGACPDQADPRTFERSEPIDMTLDPVSVVGAVWVHPFPEGPSAGFTSPLLAWQPFTVSGLTTAPFDITGALSRQYVPGHHNFSQDLAIEPRLDDSVSAAVVTELAGRDIAAVLLVSYATSPIYVGLDGALRLTE
jgi:hypothetical protein